MYSVILHGSAYAHDNGEYKRIETKQIFEVPNVSDLMNLVGNMAEASTDELRLTIEWREANHE